MREEHWINHSTAGDLLDRQLKSWPLARQNYQALRQVRTKLFELGSFSIRIQFNPARIQSSGAKTDQRSIEERPCFLCPGNLPKEQERLSAGPRHLLLCNPYPIFPEHFTLPTCQHQPQRILPLFTDFLELSRSLAPFTLFYNGPKCGASAPDHAHFQAITPGILPLEQEVRHLIGTPGQSHKAIDGISTEEGLFLLTGNWRPGFVIRSASTRVATSLFQAVYDRLPVEPGEDEPRMNLFASYEKGSWILTLIPRKLHRPWQYAAEGDERLLSSPGAADVGGLFITPLEKDFQRITPELLQDIFGQVCFSDQEVTEIFVHLSLL